MGNYSNNLFKLGLLLLLFAFKFIAGHLSETNKTSLISSFIQKFKLALLNGILFFNFVMVSQVDESKGNLKPFTFNVVFEPEATQEDVLEHSGMKRYSYSRHACFQ